ncbi:Nn.00g008440.m01.CDS01 [Neocucurbitaria sp. VM-36]
MERNNYAELGGFCGYAKVKYEERVEGRRRNRSSSEPTPRSHVYGKLHKPPTVQSLHERPRHRLQKRALTTSELQSPAFLFILEYEPYPYITLPSTFLGVYSTIDSVTLGAFKHGAYTFSREGFLDGSEYLSPTGRIKILSQAVEAHGVKAVVPDRSQSLQGEPVRLDIPHPANQGEVDTTEVDRETLFLAIHQGPYTAFCIGLFAEKSLAWGACLKNRASYTISGTLIDEDRTIGANNMPRITARLVGSGRHSWFVQVHEVDGPGP